ncbi:MAG: transposase [Clostridiales bacterium]|nr:transposase [Clostridiales bacterium]
MFFAGASYFIHAFHPAYVWLGNRVFIKTASGRKRYNVLGTLNFATKAISSISSHSCINAASVIELFNKLLAEYPRSILNFSPGKAKYQKCRDISEFIALHPSVKLFYLPPYSANLNSIERFCKYAKPEMLRRIYRHICIV